MKFAILFFLSAFLPLILCEFNQTWHYSVFSSEPLFYRIKIGNDNRYVNVHVDTNRFYSLVFGPECFTQDSKCRPYSSDFVYSTYNTGGVRVRPDTTYIDKFNDLAKYEFELYQDSITLGLQTFVLELGVIIDAYFPSAVRYSGFLGLGISEDKTSIVKQLMQDLTYPQITFQEARRYVSKKNESMDVNGYGSIVFGEYDEEYCGNFTFIETIANNKWRFKKDITTSNGTVLKDQVIALAVGQDSQIPQEIYDDEILTKEHADPNDFPSFSFTHDGKEYNLNASDYAWYREDRGLYSAHISSAKPTYGYDFALGSDFLQHYCVALRSDSNFTKLEIGFAENFGRNSGMRYAASTSLLLVLFALYLR
ncbi:unnamed protein product [Bursaphelenchus xylophilus]|uniref:(pine wood nematode) hypothetical protein n=1 Tax=Bursaphelenchus xylophilus TaxID=6326 RepID=A0A1I7RTH8_BURXY|nr:unnamed protein product [Bursaphelenchus xylophilus]CAG9122446.1 unnamed protein product [Bursaphelenchus xylophilus]